MLDENCPKELLEPCTEFAGFLADQLGVAISARALTSLCNHGQMITARKGDHIPVFEEQESAVCILQGATKLIATASRQREQIVAFHFAGDLVSVPQSGEHGYSMRSLRETRIMLFTADAFLRAARDEPRLLRLMLERTQLALYRCRDKAVGLGRKSAQERLASFLIIMTERIGSMAGKGCLLDLPMSRRDIGDSLGLTIETVSRQLGELREMGLLETDGRSRIYLSDLAALERRTGHI